MKKDGRIWNLMKDFNHLVVEYWEITENSDKWERFNADVRALMVKYDGDGYLKDLIKALSWRLNEMAQGIVSRD